MRPVIAGLAVVPDLGIDERVKDVVAVHSIHGLRPRPGSAEHQAVRESATHSGLHGMVAGIGRVLVVLDVAEALHWPQEINRVGLACSRVYAGRQGVRSVRHRVQAPRLLQMPAKRAYVSNIEHGVEAEIVLDPEAHVVGGLQSDVVLAAKGIVSGGQAESL